MKLAETRMFVIYGMLGGFVSAALLLTGALAFQYTRDAWPFASRDENVSTRQVALMPGESGDASHERATVNLDPVWIEHLGIITEPVTRETISRTLRTVATIVPDEERISHVHTRVSGWIEELYVRTTGESVSAGQPLAGIFSQDLYASQVEYLAARSRATGAPGSAVVEGAFRRLQVLGMSSEEIAEIERSGEARRLVTINAPRAGVVLRRSVIEGATVDPSTELVTIADLSNVWILAEVPENDAPYIALGSVVEVDFPASGLPPFPAQIDFLYPTLSERTRSLRVRIPVDNSQHALKPGMSGIVQFQSAPRQALTVSRDAVVDTGDMQHVFVVTSNNTYEPRPVRLGMRLPSRVEILAGVAEGELVASSGVFLIDSESRLRGSGGGGTGHGGHTAPPEAITPESNAPETATGAPHGTH